jgi:hypothetical protein
VAFFFYSISPNALYTRFLILPIQPDRSGH